MAAVIYFLTRYINININSNINTFYKSPVKHVTVIIVIFKYKYKIQFKSDQI